jgi:UDP-MurNAc hydroxylase
MRTAIRYLGHAGFMVEHAGLRVLMDPWFFPAFLGSWFPYPDNRALLGLVVDQPFDYLYVSHTHEDHFDERLLRSLDRSITLLLPKYRSSAMVRRFKALGFERVVALDHRQRYELAEGFAVTMYLDTSHKEDSGLLLDLNGFRFLDLNDCNTPMSELPSDIDLLAAQFSGAMWYPNCYDYPPDVMAQRVKEVRDGLMDTLYRKVRLTGAKAYLPSAGPACFLDPSLEAYNDPDTTIFPRWENAGPQFRERFPGLEVRAYPGDVLHIDTPSRKITVEEVGNRVEEDLALYRARRRDEWNAFYEQADAPLMPAEIEKYFGQLQRRNGTFLTNFKKHVRLVADGQMWGIRLGSLSEHFVIESEEPLDPEYTFFMDARVLRAIVEGRTGWEEALLSMRVSLHRDPDVFDLRFMGLLRYGNEPAQIRQMIREQQNKETIERDGLRMQRYCPHAGEDLVHAVVCDGVVECPRHHWRWDAQTGKCISGGTIDLRVEVLDPTHPSLEAEVKEAPTAVATELTITLMHAD